MKSELAVKEMKATDVIDLYVALENLGIKIWVDGGWAVDALLGKQTRQHEDLDIAVEHKNMARLKEHLESQGYAEIQGDEEKKWDGVWRDNAGHEIDAHAFSFDADNHVMEENHWAGFRKNSLAGSGLIAGTIVRCASLEHLLRTHDGTKRNLREKDHKDMEILCKKIVGQNRNL